MHQREDFPIRPPLKPQRAEPSSPKPFLKTERQLVAHHKPNLKGHPRVQETGRAAEIFKSEFRFGIRGVWLGNEFNEITHREAEAEVETA